MTRAEMIEEVVRCAARQFSPRASVSDVLRYWNGLLSSAVRQNIRREFRRIAAEQAQNLTASTGVRHP